MGCTSASESHIQSSLSLLTSSLILQAGRESNISTAILKAPEVSEIRTFSWHPGRLYIVCNNEARLRRACLGLAILGNIHLVPLEDRRLLKHDSAPSLTLPCWVRVTRGLYASDLALLTKKEKNEGPYVMFLVPRLPSIHMLHNSDDSTSGSKRKRNYTKSLRPPPRLFDTTEAFARFGKDLKQVSGVPDTWQVRNSVYINGLAAFDIPDLEKLTLEPRTIQLDEILPFVQAAPPKCREFVAKSIHQISAATTWTEGDNLRIISGTFIGMQCVLHSLDTANMTVDVVIPICEKEGTTVVAPRESLQRLHLSDVVRYFKAGDWIKIVAGPVKGAVGVVLIHEGEEVVFLEDETRNEVGTVSGRPNFGLLTI
jgi:transcription antitermination factor NusG